MDEGLFTREALEAGPTSFAHPAAVRFQDVDAAGIVFFPRILELFHDAWVGYLESVGQPLPEVLRTRRWAAPLRHARADFLRPLQFGDRVEAQLVRGRLDRGDLWVGHRLVGGPENRPLAVGLTIHAFVSPATMRREPMPEELSVAFAGLLAA